MLSTFWVCAVVRCRELCSRASLSDTNRSRQFIPRGLLACVASEFVDWWCLIGNRDHLSSESLGLPLKFWPTSSLVPDLQARLVRMSVYVAHMGLLLFS